MKKIIYALSAFLVTTCLSCGNANEKASDNDTTGTTVLGEAVSPTTQVPTPEAYDPDPTDTIPGDGYDPKSSDTAKAAVIRKTLLNELKDDLATMDAKDRKFKYDAFDLNNDGQDELIVGFFSPYFCGSGGCSGYILKPDGTVIDRFSVTQYPIYVATSLSEGYQDLIVDSRGYHYVKMKNGKYPGNPSVQPAYKGDPPSGAPTLLNIFDQPYPAFSF